MPVSETVKLVFGALSEKVAAGACVASTFALRPLMMSSVSVGIDLQGMTSPCLVHVAAGLPG
jgi:hypothetical protein